MYFDTVNYASVLRAFESLGHTADSCLSQQQFSSALDHLVRKRYPSHNFDEVVAHELFDQNYKGFDETVKVSSYAMSVVTAYQILIDRITRETEANKSTNDLTSYESAEVVKECRRDVESLMMAFGTRHPAYTGLNESIAQMAHNFIGQSWNSPVGNYPGAANGAFSARPPQIMASQPVQMPQRQPYQPLQVSQPLPQQPMQISQQPIQVSQQPQPQPIQQQVSQPMQMQVPQKQQIQYAQMPQQTIQYQQQPQNQQTYVQQQVTTTEKKEYTKYEKKEKKYNRKSVQALVSIVSALSLVQLVLSGHKYYAINLPMGLTGLAVAAAGLKNKMVTNAFLFFLSAAIILSIYWQSETIYSHFIHVPQAVHAAAMPASIGAGVINPVQAPMMTHNGLGQPIGLGAVQQNMVNPGVQAASGQIPVMPQFMCIQDAVGLCTLVQTVPNPGASLHPMADPSHPPPPAPVVATVHNFALNLGFFLFIDILKIVCLAFVTLTSGDDDSKKEYKKEYKVYVTKKVV